MKKRNSILCVLLAAVFIMSTAAVQSAGAAEYEKTVEVYQTSGAAGHTSLAAWGSYVFMVNPYEITVMDLIKDEVIAKWDARAIVGGADANYTSNIIPKMICVSDKYIVISMAKRIVVLENPGYFGETAPKTVAKFGEYNCARILLDGDTLVIIDYFGRSSRCEKVNLDIAATLPIALNCYSATDRRFVAAGASDGVELGYYVARMWKQAALADNKVYIGAYNGSVSAPYGDLYLLEVDLDTMGLNKIWVDNGPLTGVSGRVPSDLTMDDVADGCLVNRWSREDLGLTDTTWSGTNLTSKARLRTDKDGQQWFDYEGFDAFSSMHPLYSEARLQVGALLFGLKIGDRVYNLEYSRTDALLNGVVSVDSDYVYMVSGTTSNSAWTMPCKLWVIDRRTGEVVSSATLKNYYNNGVSTEIRNGFQNSYIVGDTLVGMVDRLDNNVALIDVSDAENIDCFAESETVALDGCTSSRYNQWATGQLCGGRIFYPLNDGRGFGIINTNTDSFSANIMQFSTPYPIMIYGEASGSEQSGEYINLKIDGADYGAKSKTGVYSAYIFSGLQSGEHSISVSSENGEESFIFSVDAPLSAEIKNTQLSDNKITAKITNNTDQYMNRAEELNIVIASYDADGFMERKEYETALRADFGTETDFESDELGTLSQGGYYKVYVSDGNKPLCQPIKVTATSVSQGAEKAVVGIPQKTELSIESRVLERTAKISGTSLSNNKVMIAVKADGEVVMYDQTECGADGKFDYTYDFSNLDYGKHYEVSVTAGFAETVTDTFDDIEESVIEGIKTQLDGKRGEALLSYLSENLGVAAFLGINLSNENFSKLSKARKIQVMNAVAEKIEEDELAKVRGVFEEESGRLIEEQIIDDAILSLNKATKDEIYDKLAENKTLFEISDELWNKYSGLSKSDLKAVNSKFAKYEIETIEDVSSYLKKAIDAIKESKGSSDTGLVGGKGNGSGSSKVSYTGDTEKFNPYTPVSAKDTFTDLEGVKWAKDSIDALAAAGIVSGTGGGKFEPYQTVTREQFIKMLILAFNVTSEKGDTSFTDVNKDDWFYEYVRIANVLGISKGNDNGAFGVGEALSREDAAVLALRTVRALGKSVPEVKAEAEFGDAAEISEYAKDAVCSMQKAGIINGLDDGSFAPHAVCSRAMAAKIIYELMLALR